MTSPELPSTDPDTAAGDRIRRTSRVGTVAAVAASVVIATAALVWLLWAAFGHATSPKVQVLGYTIDGRTVTVRFEIVKQGDDAVTCVLRARDATGAEVARERVPVTAGRGRQVVSHTLTATATPVSGEVESCRVDRT